MFALALLPLFVWMTRRVGEQRRKIAAVRQESMADMSSLVQESLSVSGILLGKTMGRSTELAQRFERESERLAGLEVRSRMTGRWMMASIQMTFAIMPALVYLFAGLDDRARLGLDLDRHARRLHDAADPALLPVGSLLGSRSTCRARSRSSIGSSSTSTCRSTSPRASGRSTRPRGEVRSTTSGSATSEDAWALEDLTFAVPAGTKTGARGRDRRRQDHVGYLVSRLYDATEGTVGSTASTCAS